MLHIVVIQYYQQRPYNPLDNSNIFVNDSANIEIEDNESELLR